MSRDWFDILKAGIPHDDFCSLDAISNIQKAYDSISKTPWTNRGKRWYWFQVEDVPGLRENLTRAKFPFIELWPDIAIETYPIEEGDIEEIDSTMWVPSIMGRTNAVMVANVYNIEQQKFKFDWEFGTLIPGQTDPTAEQLASGKKSYPLSPKEVGIILTEDLKTKRQRLEISVPPNSQFYNVVSQIPHGSKPEDLEFTNAEAAALAILSHHERRQGGKNYLKRRRMFSDFGIGPLERDTTAPEILSLVKRGFMRMNPDHNTPNMRSFPQITPKGKSAANLVDMPRSEFIGNFKKKVLDKPNELFDSWYMPQPDTSLLEDDDDDEDEGNFGGR